MERETMEGVRLDDLRLTSCRFPLGRPMDHVEFFCGKPAKPGCSWCSEHRKRVFSRLVVHKPKSETASAA